MAHKPNTKPRYEGDLEVLDNKQLHDFAKTFLMGNSTGFPRDVAAEILDRVAEAGNSGGVVEGFDAFIIGVAVRRLAKLYPASNVSGGDWMTGFMIGLNFNPDTDIIAKPPLLTA